MERSVLRLKKNEKLEFFQRGFLVHGFGKKFDIFPSPFGKKKKTNKTKNSQQNVFDDILERKKCF